MSTKDKPAKFYPAGGKLYARIVKDGKIICIFKAPPTNTQGAAMAEGLDAQYELAAHLKIRDRELQIAAENADELQQRLADAEQRNAVLFEALTFVYRVLDRPVWIVYGGLDESRETIEAALNPTESGAIEPQCLLCLDAKTVPGDIPGGFVKDCPDCCGEEG